MQRLLSLLLFIALCGLWSCSSNKNMDLNEQLAQLSVSWELVSNQIGDAPGYRSRFIITNNGQSTLDRTDWTLYYNQTNRKVTANSTQGPATVASVKGDFYSLTPSETFSLAAGESISISWDLSDWGIKESDAPLGLYFVNEEDETAVQSIPVEDYTVLPFDRPEQINRFTADKDPIPTAANRYALNQKLSLLGADEIAPIIPTPRSFQFNPGSFTWTEDLPIQYEGALEKEAQYLANFMQTHFQKAIKVQAEGADGKIKLSMGGAKQAEAYRLVVTDQAINIIGQDAAGVFYGIQSLLGLIPVDAFKATQKSLQIPAISIEDAPGFDYRGLHLDVARNFNSKEAIMKAIEIMAFYKLNKLHLHLTDDEGWRLAIEELPELTEVGSRRGHTLTEENHLQPAYGSGPDPDDKASSGNGFFSREEFKAIIRFAHDRHIEVIPELNVPGHARAAIKAMEARYRRLMEAGDQAAAEQYLLTDFEDKSVYESVQFYPDNVVCVCKESLYTFYETVVDDVVEMFQEAEVPLRTIHTGGDEVPGGVWIDSPICKALVAQNEAVKSTSDLPFYFIGRINKILQERGLITAGWEEIALIKQEDGSYIPHPDFTDANFLPYVWQNLWGNQDLGHRLANAGYPIVICNVTNLYFDLAYNKDPEEPGFYWGGFTDTRKAFEILPYDVLKSTTRDPLGNTFNVEEAYKDMEPLKAPQNIRGIQGALWSETVKGPEMMEYYLLPKLMGLAERAWSPQPEWGEIESQGAREIALDQSWNKFANALGQRELPRLDYLFGGYQFRLPLPGAIVEEGNLMANIAFPGLAITLDDGTPYEAPISMTKEAKLKAATDKRKSRLVIIEKPAEIKN